MERIPESAFKPAETAEEGDGGNGGAPPSGERRNDATYKPLASSQSTRSLPVSSGFSRVDM